MVDCDHCIINKVINQYKQRTVIEAIKTKPIGEKGIKHFLKPTNIEEDRKKKLETNFKT